ncbi:MAG: hypothetical protein IH848_09365, partial [Acidobacteria bacterium]|nr:hypothetical protein [Acidobacteriota bacterium]
MFGISLSASRSAGRAGQQATRRITFLLAALCILILAPVTQAQDDTVLIERGTSMRYIANSGDPGLGLTWNRIGFNDSGWTVGVYGIGYENMLP